MSVPKRNSRPEAIQSNRRTFHVVSSTWGKRALLQSERMATLLIEVMFHYRNEGAYRLHAFVVMRDHFHALLTVEGNSTIEMAVQKIKGGFSYRARSELGLKGEIWQRGFTDKRIWDAQQFSATRAYIHNIPVQSRMSMTAEEYPFSSAHPKYRNPQGLKPES